MNDLDVEARTARFAERARGLLRPFTWLAGGGLESLDVSAELAVRDVLTRYAFALDGRDLDGLIRLFSPDGLLFNPRGTFAGGAALAANFAWIMAQPRLVFHRISNVLVRAEGADAWVAAYYQLASVAAEGQMRLAGGTYLLRLVGAGRNWLIAEMRITDDYVHAFEPARTGAAPPPAPRPSGPLTATELAAHPESC